jgi:acetolactate synthase-1/2/3 large subunit
VFNNSDYAIISEAAARNFELPDQTYGWDDVPLDFATVAEGMGMQTMYAETADEIRDGLDTALAADEPTLVEIPTDPTEPQAREWMTE